MKKISHTVAPLVEAEIQALFDSCLASETGIIFYACSQTRAVYLRKMALAIKHESAVQSTQVESLRDSPIYGIGSYWNIKAIATEEGLYLRRLTEPEITLYMMLVGAIFAGRAYTLDCGSQHEAQAKCNYLRSLNTKIRIKYAGLETYPCVISADSTKPWLVRIRATTTLNIQNQVQEVTKEELDRILGNMSRSKSDEDE